MRRKRPETFSASTTQVMWVDWSFRSHKSEVTSKLRGSDALPSITVTLALTGFILSRRGFGNTATGADAMVIHKRISPLLSFSQYLEDKH
ncbi:hypothetical protein SK128_019181 [Halocaridina rubra]|uniref:Uncharacterized protein n=1 Tax=Halocaridina rubra TaxID=373956 RepID=A0AAN9A359_HALRR